MRKLTRLLELLAALGAILMLAMLAGAEPQGAASGSVAGRGPHRRRGGDELVLATPKAAARAATLLGGRSAQNSNCRFAKSARPR